MNALQRLINRFRQHNQRIRRLTVIPDDSMARHISVFYKGKEISCRVSRLEFTLIGEQIDAVNECIEYYQRK